MKKLLFLTLFLMASMNIQISNAASLKNVKKTADAMANAAMTRHYANSLKSDIGIVAVMALSWEGVGKDISPAEVPDILKHKVPCGAILSATKEGTVYVNFPEKCERMEPHEEEFNITVDGVISVMKEENNEKYYTFECTGHQCIQKMKNQ